MHVATHRFELPLRHVFTIARESHAVQPTVIVELREGDHRGYGEATANPFYGVSCEGIQTAVDSVREHLEQTSLLEVPPDILWSQLEKKLIEQPFALSAIDQAAHDLWGKLLGKPVHQLWNLKPNQLPPSCLTIGIDQIEVMVEKLAEMPDWPIYKIKLGTDHDVEIIERLREQTDATFRVDANGGWTLDEALRNAEQLVLLGVEFIEQPLPAHAWEDQRKLFERSPLPIVADESCQFEPDVARCAGVFHGVNIKLSKCGGLTPARRMISRAKELGLKVMVGCMTESTVGISAIAQLLPLLDYVDMDGATLLAYDIATGAHLEHGICHFPSGNGTGVELL